MKNIFLVWLDSNIHENNKDYQNSITYLRQVTHTIYTFTDYVECIEFLEEIQDDKVCLIMSGSLGESIIDYMHQMSQVNSILIFCIDKRYHEQWAKNWSKIKGVYTDIKLICDVFEEATSNYEYNTINFGLIQIIANLPGINISTIFICAQVITEIVLASEFDEKNMVDFFHYCQQPLENDQRKNQIWWWFAWKPFIYPTLNRALRLLDINMIVRMSCFIFDLHQHMHRLQQEQFQSRNPKEIFTVYSEQQQITNDGFEKLSQAEGGFISFSSFLSMNSIENHSTQFSEHADMINISFVTNIDFKKPTKACFASIDSENEIIFAMNTVFRIRNIKKIHENTRLFHIELELISGNDKDFRMLKVYIQNETYPHMEGWSRFGLILRQLGRVKQAIDIFRIVLQEETDKNTKGWLYCQIGACKADQSKYEEAIEFFEKSIQIGERHPSNLEGLATTYGNIAVIYDHFDDNDKALLYHEKVLKIQKQLLPHNDPNLALVYNNIGKAYFGLNEYAKALRYHEKALGICQQSLPSNHKNLTGCYNNIALVYQQMKNYSKASSFLEKAIKIGEKSLAADDPNLEAYKHNMKLMKEQLSS